MTVNKDTSESSTGPDSQSSTYKPQKHLLITHPRTASNLLIRLLNLDEQSILVPNVKRDYYFQPRIFTQWFDCDMKFLNEWTQDQRHRMDTVTQACFDKFETDNSETLAKGKSIFVKEHALWICDFVADCRVNLPNVFMNEPRWMVKIPGYEQESRSPHNQTIFPDEYLLTWKPTILIRHPALVFPSLYRAAVEFEDVDHSFKQKVSVSEMTFIWQRDLYDFYNQEKKKDSEGGNDNDDIMWPIVLEADDIMTNPLIMKKYCDILGFDSSKMKHKWSQASKEETDKLLRVERRMLSTINESTGIVQGKTSAGLKLDEEAKKWRAEFGEEHGTQMEKWVLAAMDDYEYLKERRLKL